MLTLTLSCSKENIEEKSIPNLQSYELVYQTYNLQPGTTVYAGSTVTYSEERFEFIQSEYDDLQNTVTVKTKQGPIKIDSNFYIQNGTSVNIRLYDSEGNIIDEKDITEVNYNYVYEF